MLDSRFPFVRRFSEVTASPRLRASVREIERRTGTNAIVNTEAGRVIFRYGDTMGGPFARSMAEMERWDGGDVDTAVHIIQYAKNAGRDAKDRVVAEQEREKVYEDQAAMQKVCEDARPDARSHAAFLDRKRRGTASVTA